MVLRRPCAKVRTAMDAWPQWFRDNPAAQALVGAVLAALTAVLIIVTGDLLFRTRPYLDLNISGLTKYTETRRGFSTLITAKNAPAVGSWEFPQRLKVGLGPRLRRWIRRLLARH